MRRQSSLITTASAVGRNIDDSAYDNVKIVADEIDTVVRVGKSADNIDIVAGIEGSVVAVVENEEDISTVAEDLVKGIGTNQSTDSAILNALTNANQTIADAEATRLDAIDTAADRVQTGLDKAATNADVVLTNADVVQTGEDKVQTGLDRVQTGLDADSTAADRVIVEDLLSSATTLAGYGITDAYTKVEVDSVVDTAVTALVDSSPEALDTLNELAAALGDDANFSTTVTNSLATKQVILAEGSFVNGDKTKLDGIESNATADQTAEEIDTALGLEYEGL